MIRGVNKYTIEVNRTGSPYFERAICFVRPEFSSCDRLDLHRAAKHMIGNMDAGVENADEKRLAFKNTSPKWLPYAICAGFGAAAGMIFGAILG